MVRTAGGNQHAIGSWAAWMGQPCTQQGLINHPRTPSSLVPVTTFLGRFSSKQRGLGLGVWTEFAE